MTALNSGRTFSWNVIERAEKLFIGFSFKTRNVWAVSLWRIEETLDIKIFNHFLYGAFPTEFSDNDNEGDDDGDGDKKYDKQISSLRLAFDFSWIPNFFLINFPIKNVILWHVLWAARYR